jgi:hypothetical protein
MLIDEIEANAKKLNLPAEILAIGQSAQQCRD